MQVFSEIAGVVVTRGRDWRTPSTMFEEAVLASGVMLRQTWSIFVCDGAAKRHVCGVIKATGGIFWPTLRREDVGQRDRWPNTLASMCPELKCASVRVDESSGKTFPVRDGRPTSNTSKRFACFPSRLDETGELIGPRPSFCNGWLVDA